MPYYDNCVRDACGCELVGDCECLCDAVAVYAKACIDAGVCIDWRTPDFCRTSILLHKQSGKAPKIEIKFSDQNHLFASTANGFN